MTNQKETEMKAKGRGDASKRREDGKSHNGDERARRPQPRQRCQLEPEKWGRVTDGEEARHDRPERDQQAREKCQVSSAKERPKRARLVGAKTQSPRGESGREGAGTSYGSVRNQGQKMTSKVKKESSTEAHGREGKEEASCVDTDASEERRAKVTPRGTR